MSTQSESSGVSHPSLVEKFLEFYGGYIDTRDGSQNQFAQLIEQYPREKRSLTIDFTDLVTFDHELADDLVADPDTVIEHAEAAVRQYDLPADIGFEDVNVRVINLEPEQEREIGKFGGEDENALRRVTGQLTKKSPKRRRTLEACFECSRCGTFSYINQRNGHQEPHECQGCERQGPFTINRKESEDVAYQRIRVQLPPEKSTGMGAESVDVEVEADLVNEAEVGDRITVSMIPRTQLISDPGDEKMVFDWYGEANHLEPEDTALDDIEYEDSIDDIKAIANSENPYQQIVDSIMPSHLGDENVKLAIALQLFGGVRKVLDDGSTTRGNSHILLIGDPGTDKTGLLSYATDLAPRSVFTSGEGSSSVGLTAAVVNDDFSEGPTLEAGAIVLANNGLVSIDEFDKMSDEEQTSMNEALSKQTVSVSKWGINATLNARTTVLAAANPKYGRFDKFEPFAKQLDLDPTLTSRFDLIFVMTDRPDAEHDRELAEHITSRDSLEPVIDPDLLRKYVAYARDTCTPTLTDAAEKHIHDAYVDLRQGSETDADDDNGRVPVTARKIDAMVRLAEASAKIRLSDRVEEQDARRAVEIVRDCLKDVGIDPETGELDADIVETGESQAQRDRKKKVRAIIEDTVDETPHGAPLESLIAKADSMGIPEGKLRHDISTMKDDGDAYEPKEDHFRLT